MKNTIKLLSIIPFLLISSKSIGQIDTLNYLKQFEINKAQYINQPLSYLLSQITEIQPKTLWSNTYGKDKNIVKSSTFKFCNKDYSFKNAVSILIIWDNFIPRNEVSYYENKNNYYFTNEERMYYGNKVIKDILVYR